MASASSCLSLLVVAVLASAAGAQNLSPPTFYDTTCLRALATIKSAVDSAVAQEPRMGASLLNQRGLLHSDQELFNGGASTDSNFSSNATAFSSAFATAMAKTGSLGQIRVLCSTGNAS